ncbi:MAG: non-reducing end alpha-L-arabinofuranosidase family hydrolase [Opitutales bacterium]
MKNGKARRRWFRVVPLSMQVTMVLTMVFLSATAAAQSPKFIGTIWKTAWSAPPASFPAWFRQITPENAGKWGVVQKDPDTFNWGPLDRLYAWADGADAVTKQHTFVWGRQQPAWTDDFQNGEDARAAIAGWFKAYMDRYGDQVDLIDVVNEPLHHKPDYRTYIGGEGVTGWDWVVWAFETARKHAPHARLHLNDYDILKSDANTTRYLEIIAVLQKRELIDGIGVQAHFLEYTDSPTIRRNLDRLAATGLPIHISEYDVHQTDDREQRRIYQEQFPIFWEHPSVMGVTLWGYREGQTWREHAHLIRKDGSERPAFTWLRAYLEREKNLSDDERDDEVPLSFTWKTGQPIIDPQAFGNDDWIALKDPSIVRHQGRYHLFGTLRGKTRSHALAYTSFADFDEAEKSRPVVLPNHDGYAAAPQVFYFAPHEKWYLICQAAKDEWGPRGQAAYATTDDISDPDSWTPLNPLGIQRTDDRYNLDFWVICDSATAYVFFTSDNGKLWRTETAKSAFPAGWSRPVVAYQGDVFEAGHVYRAKGVDLYFTLIEARRNGDQRYFKVLYADELDGSWRTLPGNSNGFYAAAEQVKQIDGKWMDYVSHGEILRETNDETLTADLKADFIFQGISHQERMGKAYGQVPWKLGLLRANR